MNENDNKIMTKKDFTYSRKVANGDLYLCPCCGNEIFLDDGPFMVYCDECGAEFDVGFNIE